MKRKAFAILIVLSLLIASVPAYALEASDNAMIKKDETLEYLLDAGYPQEIIDTMDEDLKQKIFQERHTYESSETTYGILTEDYQITYQVDNAGEICIDTENLAMLDALLAEKSTVEKILNDKNQAILSEGDTLESQSLKAELSVAAQPRSRSDTELCSVTAPLMLTDKQLQFIDNIEKQEPKAALATLSNWTGRIVVSRISNTNKGLSYSFTWNYDPYTTDVDKMAMAWSGGYQFYTSEVQWKYRVYASKYKYVLTPLDPDSGGYWLNIGPAEEVTMGSGFGYNEGVVNCGVSKDIDIVNYYIDSYYGDYTFRWYTSKHMGYLYTEIRKTTSSASTGEVMGLYYHHTSYGSPGKLSFTSKPSITMNGGSYDASEIRRGELKFYK